MMLSRAAIALVFAVGALWFATAASAADSTGRTGVGFAPEGVSYHSVGRAGPPDQRRPGQTTTQPSAPSDLTVDPLPKRRAKLSWAYPAPPTDRADSYTVQLRNASGSWDPKQTATALLTSYEVNLDRIVGDAGLVQNTQYQFRVRATVGGRDSGWSETISIIDSPLLQSNAYAYVGERDSSVSPATVTAFLRWTPVAGASYEVRYREVRGDHWDTDWTPANSGPWLTAGVRVGEQKSSGQKLATISGLADNGDLYAVQINYETASGEKVFSGRDAYIWASSQKPDRGGSSKQRVATFPYHGHFASKTYLYRVCANEFPPMTNPDAWISMIDGAIETWQTATAGQVSTTRLGNRCDRPVWADVDIPSSGFECDVRTGVILGLIERIPIIGPIVDAALGVAEDVCEAVNAIGDFNQKVLTIFAISEQSDDVVENIYRLLQGNEGDAEMSEVRIIDDPTGNDREFITSIYKLCIVSDAGGCTVSPAYASDQRGGVPATSADIYLNWEKIKDRTGAATTIAPASAQFNACIWPHGTTSLSSYAWRLVVHEAGHALGMSGASVERSALDAVLGALEESDVAGISAIPDIVAAIAGPDLDYATSHPTIASSALNYDSRVAGAADEPDCFPHPLDVLAVNALYQDQYTDPFFGPFEIETTISGTGQITRSPSRTTYPDGTEVTLTASWNNATHTFDGWGGDCEHRATLTTCQLTMDAGKYVSAVFGGREPDTSPSFGATRTFTLKRAPGASFSHMGLPTASGGNAPLSYALPNRPDWLAFDPDPPRISTTERIPASAAGNTYEMTLTVSDSDGDTDTLAVAVEVEAISGRFDVTGTGSSESAARTAAGNAAGVRAEQLDAVAYWRTADSVESETTTMGFSTASGSYTWSLEQTLRHDGVGPYDNAADAETAAKAAARAAIPQGATVVSVTIYATENYPFLGGYFSGADVTYSQSGSLTASGTGSTSAAAESAALADAQSQAPAGAVVSVVSVTTAENTSTTYTATQTWTWNADQDIRPNQVTIRLAVRDWNYTVVIWPVATAAVETVTQGVPLHAIWYYRAADDEWDVYIQGAPDFVNSLDELVRGRHYYTRVTAAHAWVISTAAAASSRTADDTDGTATSASGWSALVTCDAGPGSVRLATAPTEAKAISAAQWFISSAQGCGGAGTYTVSSRP